MSVRTEWNGENIKARILAAEKKGLALAGAYVEGLAAAMAPIKTGNLRSSLSHLVAHPIVRVGTLVEYAARIEYGYSGTDSRGRTYHQPAQPYLRPALAHKTEIKEIFAAEYKAAMK